MSLSGKEHVCVCVCMCVCECVDLLDSVFVFVNMFALLYSYALYECPIQLLRTLDALLSI